MNLLLLGESTPVKRKVGDKVIAGSINYEGTILYRAEKIGKESTVSEIVKLVTDAMNSKAPIAKIADLISGYFVPCILVIATITFVVWCLITKDVAFAINMFVSVLVISCPCSLGLATPLAIVIASGKCSQKGILIKSSESLENAHKVKTVVFDKTGTLTNGTLSISKVICYSSNDEDEIIRDIASIEKLSEHPIARAIVNGALERNIELKKANGFKTIPGRGVKSIIEEDLFLVGNRKLMEENQVEIEVNDEQELTKEGNSVLYVAKNNKEIALIGVKDVIRDSSKETINKLKEKGINTVMLTGDNEETANYIAKEIGISNVIANVKPSEKAEKIKELKKDGLVMMCGDGINDSISLITSDVGVSVSNGTDIAIDSASIVLMNNNLEKIIDLINISYKTIKNIKQNLFWAFFYNICMIPIAAGVLKGMGIVLNPMIAAFAMTISSLTVVANALRLKKI